jgi:hypothetical protein
MPSTIILQCSLYHVQPTPSRCSLNLTGKDFTAPSNTFCVLHCIVPPSFLLLTAQYCGSGQTQGDIDAQHAS